MDLVAQETAAHVVLLGMAVWVGMAFPIFMLLLAGETVVVMMLGSSLHGRRPFRWHLRNLVSLVAGLAIFIAFEMLVYGAMTAAAGQSGTDAALSALRDLDFSMLGWGLLYATAHLAIALRVAMRRADPRAAFAQNGQMQAGVTLLALLLAIPVILFGGPLALAALDAVGLGARTDAVAISLLLLVRFALMLRFCRHSEQEWAEIVDSFYAA